MGRVGVRNSSGVALGGLSKVIGVDTYLGNVGQDDSRKIYRAKTPSTQSDAPCHFDRREKSFLDPSHSLGMTGLAPSPWRLCAFAGVVSLSDSEIQNSTRNFKYNLSLLVQSAEKTAILQLLDVAVIDKLRWLSDLGTRVPGRDFEQNVFYPL